MNCPSCKTKIPNNNLNIVLLRMIKCSGCNKNYGQHPFWKMYGFLGFFAFSVLFGKVFFVLMNIPLKIADPFYDLSYYLSEPESLLKLVFVIGLAWIVQYSIYFLLFKKWGKLTKEEDRPLAFISLAYYFATFFLYTIFLVALVQRKEIGEMIDKLDREHLEESKAN